MLHDTRCDMVQTNKKKKEKVTVEKVPGSFKGFFTRASLWSSHIAGTESTGSFFFGLGVNYGVFRRPVSRLLSLQCCTDRKHSLMKYVAVQKVAQRGAKVIGHANRRSKNKLMRNTMSMLRFEQQWPQLGLWTDHPILRLILFFIDHMSSIIKLHNTLHYRETTVVEVEVHLLIWQINEFGM